MQNRFTRDGTPPAEHDYMQGWLALLIGLGLVLAMLAAPVAEGQETGAEEPRRGPEQRPAATDPPAEPVPAPEPPTSSGIEEIVVHGSESDAASDFAASDSAIGFGAEDLAALGASDIGDLAAFTPNLEIVTSGATTPTFFIRGVGLNDFNSNSTGAVAIYQDDVPRNAPALQLSTLFDVESVNILRGPQGTGLARNASAGAIKIYSRKPSGNFGGFFRTDIGNFDFRDFEGAVEAPIYEDILAGRFAFRVSMRDGTMKNRCGDAPAIGDRIAVPRRSQRDGPGTGLTFLGKKNTDAPWSICGEPVLRFENTGIFVSDIPEGLASKVNNTDNWAARGTLLFQPTLDMSWLLNAHGSRRDELSRLGQSIGTRGNFCEDGDVANCGFPEFPGDPNIDSLVKGVLGGTQGVGNIGYQAPEVRKRLIELAPCLQGTPGQLGPPVVRGAPDGNCGDSLELLASENAAKIQVARELARNLDSKPWEGDFNRTGSTTNDTYGAYLKGDLALPYGMQLTTVSGFDAYDRKIDIDLDFSPETLFQIITDDEGWQATQGVQLVGQLGDQGQLRWDVGGWFLRERLDVVVTNDLGIFSGFGVGERDYTQDLWSAAGYASLAIDFWDDFTVDGGFRYNWEQKKLDYALTSSGNPILPDGSQPPVFQKLNDTWSDPTGTVRLTYHFREDTRVFWKYTRGFKPGTYNATSSLEQGVSVARPESIDAFEAGLGGSWFDGRFDLNFSFFYYSYKDYQLFTAQQFAGGQPEFVILNAEEAEVYGADVSAVLRPWDTGYLNVNFGWLESQFLNFVQLQQEEISTGAGLVVVNRELQNTGNRLLNSPRFKVSITAEQRLPLGRFGEFTARYDGAWTDTTFFDATEGRGIPNVDNVEFLPEDTTAQRPFWLHNLRLSYRPRGGALEIAGWVRNLTNEAYKTFAFDGSTFNETTIYFVGDPRTFGGTLTINF